MGKRGPQPGAKYRKRFIVPPELKVCDDRELVAAQHLNERLDCLLGTLEQKQRYPMSGLDTQLHHDLIVALENVQGAVCMGIEGFFCRHLDGSDDVFAEEGTANPKRE